MAIPDGASLRLGPNPLCPDRMTAAERLTEVAAILATGIRRLAARKSSPLSADRAESSLDCPADQSVSVSVRNRGEKTR